MAQARHVEMRVALRASLRRALAGSPRLYLPLRRWRAPGTVLESATDLVIEGFPRSANTWAEAVIRQAAPRLNLAHHAHAAAHVMAAVQANVPVMVMYRAPDAAIASLLAMYGPRVSARAAFADYAAFYSGVLQLDPARYLPVSFAQITQSPEAVIHHLVQHFDLPLQADAVTGPEARDRILAQMRAREAGNAHGDAAICVPGNAARQTPQTQAEVAARLAHPSVQKTRARACAVYARLRGLALQ